MPHPLFATKSVDQLRADAEKSHGFKRALGGLDLTMLGVGAIIGTGIFVLTGHAAATNSGPAVALSFVIAGIASVFAGLCYSEMASMIPISGSAYTYAYATMGELMAWIIGWDLILEYLVGAATVSVGWSGYATQFLKDFMDTEIPAQWANAPWKWVEIGKTLPSGALADHGQFVATGHILNIPAILITLAVTSVLVVGIRESAWINTVIVIIKVSVVLLFIAFAASHVNPANWKPFVPENTGVFGAFGLSGIFQGATMVFFAYIGFDAVSTAAQEAKNPQRDLPVGILSSLAICTVLYIAVSLILTGVVPYAQLNVAFPVALGAKATGLRWLEGAVELGAIAGLTSVMLVMLLGQPRIFFSMARDGLFPPVAARIHPRFGTPYITTIITGLVCAVAGGLLPIDILGELTSIGTLFAFVLVSLGVMILRVKRPDIPRRFKVPGGPYLVPILGALTSGTLMYTAKLPTLIRLFGWLAIGLVVYFLYSRRHSVLRSGGERGGEGISTRAPAPAGRGGGGPFSG